MSSFYVSFRQYFNSKNSKIHLPMPQYFCICKSIVAIYLSFLLEIFILYKILYLVYRVAYITQTKKFDKSQPSTQCFIKRNEKVSHEHTFEKRFCHHYRYHRIPSRHFFPYIFIFPKRKHNYFCFRKLFYQDFHVLFTSFHTISTKFISNN